MCCACRYDLHPVLTAPASAVPALFVTVRARPGPFHPVKTASSGASPPGGGFDGAERAGTRSDGHRAGTALTGAVRTGSYLTMPARTQWMAPRCSSHAVLPSRSQLKSGTYRPLLATACSIRHGHRITWRGQGEGHRSGHSVKVTGQVTVRRLPATGQVTGRRSQVRVHEPHVIKTGLYIQRRVANVFRSLSFVVFTICSSRICNIYQDDGTDKYAQYQPPWPDVVVFAYLAGEVFEVPVVLDPPVTDAGGPLGAVHPGPLRAEVPGQRHRLAPQRAANVERQVSTEQA